MLVQATNCGLSRRALARRFCVHRSTIDRILSGQCWAHVQPEDLEAFRNGAAVPAITVAAAEKRLFGVNLLRRRFTEPEVPRRRRGFTMSTSMAVLAAATLLVFVAGCAQPPAPCAPYRGVLTLDRPECPLPAAEVLR